MEYLILSAVASMMALYADLRRLFETPGMVTATADEEAINMKPLSTTSN